MRGVSDVCGCFPTGLPYPGIAQLVRTTLLGVVQELDASLPWVAHPIVMIDTETTGRKASEDRIIEIAIVKGRDGEILSRDSWLINPGCPIPEDSSAVHGILDEHVESKPFFADVCDEIIEKLEGAIPAAHNASFDREFLLAEIQRLQRHDLRDVPAIRDRVVWIDPLVWARHLFQEEKSRKLSAMAELLGVEMERAHRATDDASAALRLMYKMAEQNRVPSAYGEFIQEQVRLSRIQGEARSGWRRS